MAHEYSPSAADLDKVTRANGSGRQPVVFVHGLWLLDSSWNHWVLFFEQAGYSAVAPSWPDDPPTVELAREDPSVFGNAVSQDEARQLYEQYHVAGSGIPIFQAAFANFNPRTEARADKKNPDRGPMLIIGGEKDHQVPWAIANATYKEQRGPRRHRVAEIPDWGTRSPSTADGRK